MKLLAIDIGNTSTCFGIVEQQFVLAFHKIATQQLQDPEKGLAPLLEDLYANHTVEATAFCSVVPNLNPTLETLLKPFTQNIFHLTHKTYLGPAICYHDPPGIGEDRFADVVGADVLYKPPLVILDLGTAFVIDILTESRGYETGIIAPGLGLMADYLHEKTALLPKLNLEELKIAPAINQPTLQAMQTGCVVGFCGMVQALLDYTLRELKQREKDPITLIVTGGDASCLNTLDSLDTILNPNLTLIGLAEAYARWQNKSQV